MSPSFIEPMKALPVEKLPERDWFYEIKFDGYRALAFKEGKDVKVVSRNKKAFDYPQLLRSAAALAVQRVFRAKEEPHPIAGSAIEGHREASRYRLEYFRSQTKPPIDSRNFPPF
jgi:ATP dependent DNA ligase domain